jgi:tetratricopeptide (TPR) repeat protein
VGIIYQEKGDYDAALKKYEESLEIKEKIGDIKGAAISLHQVGIIYQEKGDYDAALKKYEESLEIEKKIGDIAGMAASFAQIGKIHLLKEQYPDALRLYLQSFAIFSKLGSPNANIVKRNINDIKEKMATDQFDAIVKEYGLEKGVFDGGDGVSESVDFH